MRTQAKLIKRHLIEIKRETAEHAASLIHCAAELLSKQSVQTHNEYLWRQIGGYRWLYVRQDNKRSIVGGITKDGTRRYRIQLACHHGILLSEPIIFERFKLAQSVLKARLRIIASMRRQSETADRFDLGPADGERPKSVDPT